MIFLKNTPQNYVLSLEDVSMAKKFGGLFGVKINFNSDIYNLFIYFFKSGEKFDCIFTKCKTHPKFVKLQDETFLL